MREVRRFRWCTRHDPTYEPSRRMVKRRKALGKRIVQWRKEHAATMYAAYNPPIAIECASGDVEGYAGRIL